MPYGFNEDKSKYDIPEIPDLPIDTDTIADEAVTTAKLADESVTTAKLDDESVTTAKLADESVTEDKLGTDVQDTLDTLQESVSKSGDITRTPDVVGMWIVGYNNTNDMSIILKLQNGSGLELFLTSNGSKLQFIRRPNWANSVGATTIFTK